MNHKLLVTCITVLGVLAIFIGAAMTLVVALPILLYFRITRKKHKTISKDVVSEKQEIIKSAQDHKIRDHFRAIYEKIVPGKYRVWLDNFYSSKIEPYFSIDYLKSRIGKVKTWYGALPRYKKILVLFLMALTVILAFAAIIIAVMRHRRKVARDKKVLEEARKSNEKLVSSSHRMPVDIREEMQRCTLGGYSSQEMPRGSCSKTYDAFQYDSQACKSRYNIARYFILLVGVLLVGVVGYAEYTRESSGVYLMRDKARVAIKLARDEEADIQSFKSIDMYCKATAAFSDGNDDDCNFRWQEERYRDAIEYARAAAIIAKESKSMTSYTWMPHHAQKYRCPEEQSFTGPPTELQYSAHQAVDSAAIDHADMYAKAKYAEAALDLSDGSYYLVAHDYMNAAVSFQSAIDAAHLASAIAKINKNMIVSAMANINKSINSESSSKDGINEGSVCSCRNCRH